MVAFRASIAPGTAFCNCELIKHDRPASSRFRVAGLMSWLFKCQVDCHTRRQMEWTMRPFGRTPLALALSIGLAMPASSQETQQEMKRDVASAPKVLTGKERLGPKWTDEQRIDNCKVPVEKRGTKPRPSACTQATTDF